MTGSIVVRVAGSHDGPSLRGAIVELQEHERRLSGTRRPGEDIADTYLAWLRNRATVHGAILVAEVDGVFAGFVAGWVEDTENIAETADSNRFGYVSDVCVLTRFRRRRLALRLLTAMEERLRAYQVSRMRVVSLAANAPARAAYERAGFAPYEVVYEKALAPEAKRSLP
jgi:ribosomal protein S18 acetylase RimI-like enzyme